MTESERELEMLEASGLLLESGALLRGQFTLANGTVSNYYFDGRLFTMHPKGRLLTGRLVWNLVKQFNPDAIGGLETGAIPIVDAVAMTAAHEGTLLQSFYVRKAPKEHGTMKLVEGVPENASGTAVIVDDTITSGHSVLKAVRAAEDKGWKVLAIVALVDRHNGGGQNIRDAGYEFQSVFRTDKDGRVLYGKNGSESRVLLSV